MFALLQYASLLSSIGQAIITAVLISSTPKTSGRRVLVVPFLILLAYYQFAFAALLSKNIVYNAVIACVQFVTVIHCVDLLLIYSISANDLIHQTSLGRSAGTSSYVFHALRITYNFRGVGTRWQVKNVPRFPSYFASQSSPSRGLFLIRQTAILLWQYLLIDVLDAMRKQQSPEEVMHLYAPGAELLFFDATAEQRGSRIAVSLMTWYIVARLIIDSVYRLLSVVFVGSGVSSPQDWPPFFGSMWDAYTLRNYWG